MQSFFYIVDQNDMSHLLVAGGAAAAPNPVPMALNHQGGQHSSSSMGTAYCSWDMKKLLIVVFVGGKRYYNNIIKIACYCTPDYHYTYAYLRNELNVGSQVHIYSKSA